MKYRKRIRRRKRRKVVQGGTIINKRDMVYALKHKHARTTTHITRTMPPSDDVTTFLKRINA